MKTTRMEAAKNRLIEELKAHCFKLDPKKKKAWVEELRSGLYQQGKARLYCKGDRYCCLGVYIEACELDWVYHKEFGWSADGGSGAYLPSHEIPNYIQRAFAIANDHGVSFNDISDIIKEYL